MSYFDQYSGIAGGYASQYGIPQPIFFGLIQQESSWNPNASPGTSSAFGFTQLLSGTASQLGLNRFDPSQNLQGGAQYLASMPGSDWTTKLAHYFAGPGTDLNSGSKLASDAWSYASSVLKKAKSFLKTGEDIGALLAGDPLPLAGDILGGGQDSCGVICQLQNWFDKSHFIERIALAVLALLFVLGGLYLMKGD